MIFEFRIKTNTSYLWISCRKKRQCFINDQDEESWWRTSEVRWHDSDDVSANFATTID